MHLGSLSHGAVAAFDEVLSINGVAVESLQAVATIREAAAGQLVVVKRGCPARLREAARRSGGGRCTCSATGSSASSSRS